MRTPAISVIVPCYNPPKFIKQCIKSVLCQSMKDFEVIVVDDGSTDSANFKCVEKMSQKDSRLRIIWNRHQGLGPTRKDGYLQARGEYIFFMDCDDILPKEALEILYQAAIGSGADVTIGNYTRVADSFGLIQIKRTKSVYDPAEGLIQKMDILKVCYGSLTRSTEDSVSMAAWGRLYKSNIIRQAIKESKKDLFPSSIKTEDRWFNLLLMPYVNSIYLTNDIVYYYRFGGVTSTTSFHLRNNAEYFNCRFDLFEKWNFQKGHPSTFVIFAYELYEDLKNIILSKRFSKDEIAPFIAEQMTSVKIVDWARKNMAQIEKLPECCKRLVTEKPEDIYRWYSNALHSKRSRINRVRKSCAMACAKVLDIIYEVLY